MLIESLIGGGMLALICYVWINFAPIWIKATWPAHLYAAMCAVFCGTPALVVLHLIGVKTEVGLIVYGLVYAGFFVYFYPDMYRMYRDGRQGFLRRNGPWLPPE